MRWRVELQPELMPTSYQPPLITNPSNNLFISNDEPHYKVAAIFFAMIQKRYYCANEVVPSYAMIEGKEVPGIFPRFERF